MSQAVVRAVFDSFQAGDLEGALSRYASDVRIRQGPGTPWAGSYSGRLGFDAFAKKLFTAVGSLEVIAPEFVGEGERVVVLETLRMTRGPSKLDVETIEVFEVHRERVQSVDVWYRDPERVRERLAHS